MRWIALVFVAGCAGQSAAPMPMAPLPSDQELEGILSYSKYRTAAFVKVNKAPYPSTLASGSFVNVYVSAEVAAEFEEVAPESTGSAV